MRINQRQYKLGLLRRYKDLKDILNAMARDRIEIYPDNIYIREMALIESIARLNDFIPRSTEEDEI